MLQKDKIMGKFNFFNLFKAKEPEVRYDSWNDTWGKITQDDAFYNPERIGELTKKIDAMIAKGGDINLQDRFGKTMLMYAAKEGNAECVEALLDRFANFRIPDSKGRTALMMAAFYDHLDVVNLLVDYCPAPAHVRHRDFKGRTALMYALRPFRKVQFGAFSTNAKIVNKLLENGASVVEKDYKGRNALDYWEPFEASMGQMVDLEAKKMYQKYQEESNLVAEALKKAVGGKDERSTLHDDEKSVLKTRDQNVAITATAVAVALEKGRG